MLGKFVIEVPYKIIERIKLDGDEMEDLLAAEEARKNSHTPYSHFAVGAAIRTNDGTRVVGWNVENAVYQVLHAEENAIGRMLSKARDSGLERVTVVGGINGTPLETPVSPCGICRQKLVEFANPSDNPTVVMAGINGAVQLVALRDLLPLGFFPANVVKK